MKAIGAMAMPQDFRYREVFLRGKPQHNRNDSFRLRHPRMDTGHRAKIFSPFDALKGFSEAVESKNVLYEDKAELSPEDSAELGRRLTTLHQLTFNSRMAWQNRIRISVTWYEPCADEDHDAYGIRGRYRTITGICWKVDAEIEKTILVDRTRIRIEDILRIEASEDIFQTDWDDPWLEQ